MRRGAAAIVALAIASLAACSTTAPLGPGESPWTHGRLSVRVAASGAAAARSMTADFELRGNADSGELHLDSPLGTRLAVARWAPGLAMLETSDGERRYDDLEALSRGALGEALPLAALPDWLAGRPWPGAPAVTSSTGFAQMGWVVDTARLADGMVEARRDAAPALVLRARIDRDS